MMRNLILLLVFMSATMFSQPRSSSLNSNYQIKVGDYAAILLRGFIGVSSKLYSACICTYEPDANKLDVEIYGDKGDVEGAREIINEYWNFIKTSYIPYAKKRLGVSLNEINFRIMYYNRESASGTKLVLQFINGQFGVPSN
jgi:hypothetical protein